MARFFEGVQPARGSGEAFACVQADAVSTNNLALRDAVSRDLTARPICICCDGSNGRRAIASATDAREADQRRRVGNSAQYLVEHLHEVPVLVIPCVEGRPENFASPSERAALTWGAILPATWSFMLAARSRGLGTVLTAIHLDFEGEAAEVMGIPYERVMQVGLVPVAYTVGTKFNPASRKPLEDVVHLDRW